MESLVGKKFHRLLVLERLESKVFPSGAKQIKYKCLCDCGKYRIVLGQSLKSGNTKSCGCIQRESIKKIGKENIDDITNKAFGKLFVLGIDNTYDGVRLKWICRCECGKTISVFGDNLKSGNTSSCGCFRKELISILGKNNISNLINHRFGKLLVLDLFGTDKENGALWECLCDCGNIKIISTQNLSKGTISCGCLTESYLASELKKHFKKNKNAQTEKKLFKNPETNHWLRCDIYIPENIFIEVHGSQHYEICGWHRLQAEKNMTTPEYEFTNQKNRDNLKKIFCEERGIYIEIDLRKFKISMEAIDYIENILKTL